MPNALFLKSNPSTILTLSFSGKSGLSKCSTQSHLIKSAHFDFSLASESALTQARSNAELNGVADRLTTIKQDAFKALEEFESRGIQFDMIVLDPPKLARNRQGIDAALRGYYSLNRFAMGLITPGGYFVTCSCSGQITHEMFADMLGQAALHANRRLQLLEVRGPSADHPSSVHCLETDYLKCYLCRVL